MTSRSPMLLIANAAVRRAGLWRALPEWPVKAYSHREFEIGRHLSPDVPVLIYQTDRRYAATLRFLDRVSAIQSDLCIILLGGELGAERVAALLRHGGFDYVTWPCSPARLRDSIADGLANRRTFLEVRNLSDELARTNRALAQERDALAEYNRQLSGLHQLTQALAGSLDVDTIVNILFGALPRLVPAEVMALVHRDPLKAWTWSHAGGRAREESVRTQLLGRLGQPEEPGRRSAAAAARQRPPYLTLVPRVAAPADEPVATSAGSVEIPLMMGSHGIGVLHVERAADRPFSKHEHHLLATVGTSVALTLRNAETHHRLQDLALRDPLTGALNRRALDAPLTRELKAGLRYGTPACLILLDLDYFKTVNDLLGHRAGDHVLTDMARLVQGTVRDVDSVARYGGEEFAVILPHTQLDQAYILAERIRAGIERHAFDVGDGQVRLTASLGVASMQANGVATVADWIAAADQALYRAKGRGRNCVVTYRPDAPSPAQSAAVCLAA